MAKSQDKAKKQKGKEPAVKGIKAQRAAKLAKKEKQGKL
jgi:hypothetical protein